MQPQTTRGRLPKITVTAQDFEALSRLANAALHNMPDVAEGLLTEIERARIVEERSAKPNVVRMGSTLTYQTDGHEERTVTLVFPVDADIAKGRISILTPIGTALIGLAEGQTIPWVARDGRRHELTLSSVKPPQPQEQPA